MNKGHNRHLLFFFLIYIVLAGSATAQVAGGATESTDAHTGFRANNYIAGTVFGPSGKPIDIRMTVRLSSVQRGDIVGSTDDYGRFIFNRVAAGNYTVTVDGEKEFETASQQVGITETTSAIPQTYTISIRLTEKAKAAAVKPIVVDQGSLGVPSRASELFKKAGVLSKAGDNKGSAEQLELAVAEYPNYFDAYSELGVQYMKLNQLEKADDALKAAIKIKRDAYEPLVNRGITLFRLKHYEDAEQVLRTAVAAKDQSAVAHYYLGRTLMGIEKYDAAETELNLAIKLGGDEMKEGHRMLANLFIQKGEDQKAVSELEIYLKLAPNAPDADNLRKVIGQLKGPGTPVPTPKPF